ncbi:aspartate phosphatase [Bacillus subtilis]|uniref:Rap family tetratricopeptide repeat protein n=1 Tax=Bacillus subtilis TaxID=1423 RepID=UPI002254E450|nr:Rap family tetratricopeptide repeat protein [Bacillus subtilis]MCX4074702.1 aspartate phosphatase [Bacillus subtilis]
MSTKISYTVVGQTLNEWYQLIKQNNIKKAEIMREEIKKSLTHMEENEKIIVYFNLIDSRYKLMKENYKDSGKLLWDLEQHALEESTDDMIQYYFYFFTGMCYFYENDFIEAINSYKIAQQNLDKVPDKKEKAEFHYQLAVAYYQMHQNIFSLNHAEQALGFYNSMDGFSYKLSLTKMVIAHNKLDLHQYNAAESLFEESITIASKADEKYAEALGNYNLGICYERQEKLDLAKDCFIRALGYEESNQIQTKLRAAYMLSRVLFKLNCHQEAQEWYTKAKEYAQQLNNHTYLAKLSIIYSIYKEVNESLLDMNLAVLKKAQLWSDVSELSINAARYFKKKDCLKLASKYFDEGIIARDKIHAWTEELNS